MSYRLSKSRIAEFLQCPKRLFLSVHRPELKEESPSAQARFEIGHQVGALAQQLYPDGIMIGDERNDLRAALEQTRQVLRDHPDKPLFEATLQHGGILIRADILIPDDQGYRMVEVKSSTSVKDYHLPDCAMQAWTIEHAGVHLNKISLMHIDNSFVYRVRGDYRGLLRESEIDGAVRPYMTQIADWISQAQNLLMGDEPTINPGAQCSTPFDCPFMKHCHAGQPEYPVTMLPNNIGKRGTAASLQAMGYQDIREVPEGLIESPILERVRRATMSGQPELDSAARDAIISLPYPRYYLDFETIQFTVPLWLETRPFQQLPFQWSCHIENSPVSLEHREFLGLSGEPPMRSFAESLISAVGTEGAILVYNQGFEMTRIRELAEMFPDLAEALSAINERIVDLLPITRQHYYHPEMRGSWSIKAVLPTIAPDLDYSNLQEVQDGGMAQSAFLEAIHPDTSAERREVLRGSLLRYCERDTLAMVRLAWFFTGQSSIPEFLRKQSSFGILQHGCHE
jgi:hypothetical protein